jgi:hypothetical protein
MSSLKASALLETAEVVSELYTGLGATLREAASRCDPKGFATFAQAAIQKAEQYEST